MVATTPVEVTVGCGHAMGGAIKQRTKKKSNHKSIFMLRASSKHIL
jgi:hypothetical protein